MKKIFLTVTFTAVMVSAAVAQKSAKEEAQKAIEHAESVDFSPVITSGRHILIAEWFHPAGWKSGPTSR